MPSPFPGMNPYLEQEDVWHGLPPELHCRRVSAPSGRKLPGGILRANPSVCSSTTTCSEWTSGRSPLQPECCRQRASKQWALKIRCEMSIDRDRNVSPYIEIRRTGQDARGVSGHRAAKPGPSTLDPEPHREQYIGQRRIRILRSRDPLRGNRSAARWQSASWESMSLGCRLLRSGEPVAGPALGVSMADSAPRAAGHDSLPVSDGVPDAQLDLQASLQQVL